MPDRLRGPGGRFKAGGEPGVLRVDHANPSVSVEIQSSHADHPMKRSKNALLPQTAAEIAREKNLRSDPLCSVLSPYLVSCKKCASYIKLSAKSAYDPAHWYKHRVACVRKLRAKARRNGSTSSTSAGGDVSAIAVSPTRDILWHESPAKCATWDIEDYLLKSQRASSVNVLPVSTNCNSWTWDKLRPPVFSDEINSDATGATFSLFDVND